MTDKIRWGIIGTGSIATSFATGLKFLPEAELVAVGSRSSASANRFANMFGIPHRHASYEALVHDPEVDVVYVATPHPLHKENSLLCLQAGKAVLCEKPFTINAAEAETIIQYARQEKLFLMEAMWTRFIPAIVKLREWLAEGIIGEVRMLVADFGFRAEFDPQSRLFALELGGGGLLDIGIYPLSLASMILGTPARITSMAHLGETGVDEQSAVILGYEGGQLADLFVAIRTDTPTEALVLGTEGSIKIHSPMYRPDRLTLSLKRFPNLSAPRVPDSLKRLGRFLGLSALWQSLKGHRDREVKLPIEGNGYNYEAAEVMRCLRAGKLESEHMPLDETLSIMKTMDRIRAQWELKYPME